MIRWTAKFLLLVLLAGPFAPIAAAWSIAQPPSAMAMPVDHCMRKSVAAAVAMPGCHHHDHVAATPSEPAHTPLTVRSNNCCDGHECCRSMVRCCSVNLGPRPMFTTVARAGNHVPLPYTSFVNRDVVNALSVRGPPAL
jgi:hypothetical protein